MIYKPIIPDWVADILDAERCSKNVAMAIIGHTKEWNQWKYSYSRKLKYARLNGYVRESEVPKE